MLLIIRILCVIFVDDFLQDSVLTRNYNDDDRSSDGSTCSATGEHRSRRKFHPSDSLYSRSQDQLDSTFSTIKGS